MLAVLKQRNFALLWFGGLISFMGDWVMFTALPLYVLNITGSVAAMGLFFVVQVLPGIVLGSFAGVFVDRWDRKTVLVITNLLMAPLYMMLLLFDTPEEVWVVYVVAVVGNVIRQLLNPAENALLPKLVGESDLVTANSLNSLNNSLARLIGPAVGGVVFAVFGFAASVLIDVATFVIAAGLIMLISAPRSVTRATPHETEGEEGAESKEGVTRRKSNVLTEWLEGMQVIRENRILASLLLALMMCWLADGVITVLLAVYVKDALNGGALELGWLMTAQAVGGLAASVLIGRLSKRVPAWQMVGFGLLLFGIFDLLIFGIPILPLNLFFMALVGLPLVALDVGALTLFQSVTPDRYRGRIFGTVGTTSALMLLIGRTFATVVGEQVNVVLLLSSTCVLLIGGGLLALRLLHDPNQVPLAQMQSEAA